MDLQGVNNEQLLKPDLEALYIYMASDDAFGIGFYRNLEGNIVEIG